MNCYDDKDFAAHEQTDQGNETQDNGESRETEAEIFQEQFASCVSECSELRNTCQRVMADFENYKKRMERDRASWTYIAQAEVLKELLPIVDDFDRAIAEHRKKEHSAELNAWLSGFELIGKSLYKFLATFDVTIIEQMSIFDPQLHEALAQIDSPAHGSGTIVDVVQQGFMHKDRVLRPARVTVAK